MKIRDLLRHAAIALLGGGGLFLCLFALWEIRPMWGPNGWMAVLLVPLLFGLAAPLLAAAYFVIRRDYRPVCALGCGLATMVFWVLIANLPKDIGLTSFNSIGGKRPLSWLDHTQIIFSVAWFLGSFKMAGWFNRTAFTFLCRHVQNGPREA